MKRIRNVRIDLKVRVQNKQVKWERKDDVYFEKTEIITPTGIGFSEKFIVTDEGLENITCELSPNSIEVSYELGKNQIKLDGDSGDYLVLFKDGKKIG